MTRNPIQPPQDDHPVLHHSGQFEPDYSNTRIVTHPPQDNDVAPLVDAAVRILTYPDPPLPTLPPDTKPEPGIPIIEDIVYQ